MPKPPLRTMVCVTVQKNCERLIREGAALAGDTHLHVVHVARSGEALLGAGNDSEALEYLYRISREYSASMDVLRADDVMQTIVKFAKDNKIECIVMGSAGKQSNQDFSGTLRAKLPGVALVVVTS